MQSTSSQAVSLASVDTVYSADCIEFCPFEGFEDIFICGTYQILQEKSEPSATSTTGLPLEDEDDDDHIEEHESSSPATSRVGRLLLYKVGEDQASFDETQRIDLPAILDAKWSTRLDTSGNPILGVADAKGHIRLFTLDRNTLRFTEIESISVADESILCLSLDWSNRLDSTSPSSIIASLSSGSLVHLIPSTDGSMEVDQTWRAHDFEPWITSWDNWQKDIVWSGGDDCKLKQWDVRAPFRPTSVNKNFPAGVTTITSSPHTEHLLAVGSYDSILRLFDTRNPSTPIMSIPVGGGIWRTRFHPNQSRKTDILLACMHDGFKVVCLDPSSLVESSWEGLRESWEELEDGEGKLDRGEGWEIVTRFEGHESLAYGADWSRKSGEDSLIASCSFYDHQMHIWRG